MMTITHVILARVYKKVIIDTSVIKLSTFIHNHSKMYPEERKHIPVLKQIFKLKANHSQPNVVQK
jgi:hypothetical protein